MNKKHLKETYPIYSNKIPTQSCASLSPAQTRQADEEIRRPPGAELHQCEEVEDLLPGLQIHTKTLNY